MKATELSCYIYEVGNCKKDLHLSVNLNDFNSSKLSLEVDKLNSENFKVLYNGNKFRLFVKKLYGKVKQGRAFEDREYLSIKDDCGIAKKKLYEVFSVIKELISRKVEGMWSFIEWNKIWLNCTEYDLTKKHLHHFENLYLAVDGVISIPDPYLTGYKLDCEIMQGDVYLCDKCHTFLL